MKKPAITLLSTAVAFSITAHNPSTPQRLFTAQNDTITQRNGSTADGKNCHIAMQDTLRLKLNRLNVDSKAVETKKFDTFNEKMKEPWLGGLLKDIIFH